MRYMRLLGLALLFSPCLLPAAYAAEPGDQYCQHDAITGDTGTDDATSLGVFEMHATVLAQSGKTLISFANHMPDSGTTLAAHNLPATGDAQKGYRFHFTDGSGNHGKGILKINGDTAEISLTMTKHSPEPFSGQIGRQYGDFTLTKQACATMKNL